MAVQPTKQTNSIKNCFINDVAAEACFPLSEVSLNLTTVTAKTAARRLINSTSRTSQKPTKQEYTNEFVAYIGILQVKNFGIYSILKNYIMSTKLNKFSLSIMFTKKKIYILQQF